MRNTLKPIKTNQQLDYWFTVIIPVKDDQRIKNLIFALKSQPNFIFIQVLIIFNGAKPDFIHEIKNQLRNIPNAKTILLKMPSIPHAINVGIISSVSEKVVILDSDCLPSKNYLASMNLALNKNLIVNGQICFVGNNWFAKLTAKLRNHIFNVTPKLFYAPNVGFQKKIFNDCGYFNETLKYGFDSEFGTRLDIKKYHIRYNYEAMAFHECHTKIIEELRIWQHYGKGRAYRYFSGSFGNKSISTFIKALTTPQVFYLQEGIIYNLFAFSYLVIRNLSFIKALISKKYG